MHPRSQRFHRWSPQVLILKVKEAMNKIKVLLVEDEASLAMILSDTLEAQGFEMRTAHDGEEGLRMFDDQKPDVLVADVMMPKMDGFEMVRRIRKTDSRTPVLFLTARSAVNDVVESKDILLQLWGDDSFFNSRSLHVFITKLRHKLSADENIRIINVRGIGYKMIC